MEEDIAAGHIDPVESAFVTAADDQVVYLAVGRVVEDQMEGGRVDERKVVNTEVRGLDYPHESRAVGTLAGELIAIALHGALGSLREEFEVIGVLDDDPLGLHELVFAS